MRGAAEPSPLASEFMARSGLKNELAAGWTPSDKIAKWAKGLGYGDAFVLDSDNVNRIAERHSGTTSGLYLLEATNHEVYIGVSSTHVRTRFNSHSGKWPDMQAFRFIPSTESEPALRDREKSFVHDAERRGFVHRNHEYATVIKGKKKLDELINPGLQTTWLRRPLDTNLRFRNDDLPTLEPSQLAGNRYKYERLIDVDGGQMCIDVLAAYLRNCVPLPIRTEATFWTTTCYPDWNQKNRMLTCTMDWLETLYIHRDNNTGRLFAVIGIDRRELPRLGAETILRVRYGAVLRDFHEKSGGSFVGGLDFDDPQRLIAALNKDTIVRRAAARYAHSRMTRGQSAYKPSHNRNLAGPALARAFPERADWT